MIEQPIVADGEVVGYRLVRNPASVAYVQLSQQTKGWAALFGTTPADRQPIPAVSKPDAGPKMLKPRVKWPYLPG